MNIDKESLDNLTIQTNGSSSHRIKLALSVLAEDILYSGSIIQQMSDPTKIACVRRIS